MGIMLIDAKNALFRFGFVFSHLDAPDGRGTGALHGLLMAMLRLKNRYPDTMPVVVWDGPDPDRKAWRYALYPEYKGARRTEEGPSPEALAILAQIPMVEGALNALGIPQVKIDAVEADDVISIIAYDTVARVESAYVYSSDNDFYQLIPDGVVVLTDKDAKNKMVPVTPAMIFGKYRCAASDLLKVRAVVGDKSDSIPGIRHGIGVVNASKMVSAGLAPTRTYAECNFKLRDRYPGLENNWSEFRRNYKLMRLPRTPDSAVFTASQRNQLRWTLDRVRTQHEKRPFRPHKQYLQFCSLMAEYDMQEAVAKRNALWRMFY